MHRRAVLLCVTLASLLASGCKKDSGTDPSGTTQAIEGLLVRNSEIAGWTFSGSQWVASSVSELTTYIDGLADIYQRHGFVEAAHQDYQGSVNSRSTTLRLTVYNQGTASNAASLYNDTDLGFSGAIDWTGGAGEAAHYVRNAGLSQLLGFQRGSYFVLLEIGTDSDESLNVLKTFALNVDGKIPHG